MRNRLTVTVWMGGTRHSIWVHQVDLNKLKSAANSQATSALVEYDGPGGSIAIRPSAIEAMQVRDH